MKISRPPWMKMSRSNRYAFCRTCVVHTTVRFVRRSDWSSAIRSASVAGSRPDDGSSRKSTDGLASNSMATLTRLRCPPDRREMRLPRCSLSESRSMTRSTSAAICGAGRSSRRRALYVIASVTVSSAMHDVVLRHETHAGGVDLFAAGERDAADEHLARTRRD